MNEYIDDNVLDIIDNNIQLLGNGLYGFLETVVCDYNFNIFSEEHKYTLGLFLMNMFDDDVDAMVTELLKDGFHQWSTLDEWNHYRNEGGDDLQHLYEDLRDIVGGLPSKVNLDGNTNKYLHIDYSKYESQVDFTCRMRTKRSTICNLPIIWGDVILEDIPKNLWDKLYVGYHGIGEGERVPEIHAQFEPAQDYQSSFDNPGSNTIIYVTISEFFNRLNNHRKKYESDVTVSTALPRNILEKYNLPIYDGK